MTADPSDPLPLGDPELRLARAQARVVSLTEELERRIVLTDVLQRQVASLQRTLAGRSPDEIAPVDVETAYRKAAELDALLRTRSYRVVGRLRREYARLLASRALRRR